MLELLALALFQIATITGSAAPTTAQHSTSATCHTGTGGWGHDIATPAADTVGVGYTGTGGWGHD